ncbi:MAG TPA: ScpA family protein [Acidimicrobiia bacterium]|jgi:segregation and condensation protein A|nr:ScpA family protein [Acidimicrobiia bacterium]
MSYAVRTPVFEGPFDLLLHLILKQEVELWEVSLHEIVDVYLSELERMDQLDLDVATEFLLIAATLVELKARRLLPGLDEVELDEELLRFEERDLLLARLLECKTFKDAAQALAAHIRRADRSVPRTVGPEEPYRWMVPDPLERVKPDALRAAALRAMAAPPVVVVDTDHVAPVRASVREAVESVLRLLPASEPMSFRALVSGAPHRLEVIVRFLAVLELYKQGVVDLLQFTNFGELTVRRLHDGETALDAASLADWDDPAIPVDADDDRDDRDDREAIDLGIDDDLPEVPEVVLEPAPQGQPA